MDKKVGSYSFIVGVIIAVVLGLIGQPMLGQLGPWLVSLMVLLGLIVGFMNVSGKSKKDFIMYSVALVILSYAGSAGILGSVEVIGVYIKSVFDYVMAFVVPATVVVALKDIWEIAKEP